MSPNEYVSYWAFNGVPVIAEFFDDDVELDVGGIYQPDHDTGIVPADETHVLVLLPQSQTDGWWCTEDTFYEYAEPLSPGSLERYEWRLP